MCACQPYVSFSAALHWHATITLERHVRCVYTILTLNSPSFSPQEALCCLEVEHYLREEVKCQVSNLLANMTIDQHISSILAHWNQYQTTGQYWPLEPVPTIGTSTRPLEPVPDHFLVFVCIHQADPTVIPCSLSRSDRLASTSGRSALSSFKACSRDCSRWRRRRWNSPVVQRQKLKVMRVLTGCDFDSDWKNCTHNFTTILSSATQEIKPFSDYTSATIRQRDTDQA